MTQKRIAIMVRTRIGYRQLIYTLSIVGLVDGQPWLLSPTLGKGRCNTFRNKEKARAHLAKMCNEMNLPALDGLWTENYGTHISQYIPTAKRVA